VTRDDRATTYEVTVHGGEERGIEVRCPVHDERETFQPGYRRVAFACEGCGRELELTLHDLAEWRDLGERC
jgi:uncharacterized protein (DUF983 family)